MNTLHYRPWPARRALQEEVRQAFGRVAGTAQGEAAATAGWVPRVDIREEAERFVILADLPGIDPQDIEIHMDKGVLSISGERKADAETDRYSRIERRHGNFHRRFALPDSADAQGIAALGRNGVLEISIPKRPETTPRRIQVATGTVQ